MSERERQAHCPHCGPYGRPKRLIHEDAQVYVQCEVHGSVPLRRDVRAKDGAAR
jgi:uncharacterized Zn finger protein